MDYSYSEQEYRWAQEVLYLHSLWHRGPPLSTSPYIPYPIHHDHHHHHHHHHPALHPTPSYPNPNPNRSLCYAPERGTKRQRQELGQGKEWPCDPAAVVPEESPLDVWPRFEPAAQQNPALLPNSAAWGKSISMQRSAIQACRGFFSWDLDSESECDSGTENGDINEFFMRLFDNDTDFRNCYEKNSESGEFYCLVCEARMDSDKGKGKVYRGCAALVQHASAARNVGRRVAHRVFARSICRVLGWDPQRLPIIVLLPGSVVKADQLEDALPRSNKKQKQEWSQDKEWPCDPASVPEQSPPLTWPSFEQPVQNPTASPSSAAQGALLPVQLSAIQLCKGFFSQDSGSESEFESGSESDVDEFFMGLLENAVSLRGCYEKNSENGEFYCLVCEAREDGNKGKGRLYRGCAALVQHAGTIQKVGWRVAHRSFARFICRVLGWDPQRLPSIVLLPGSLAKADNLEDKQETVAIHIPSSTSDSPKIWKRDTSDAPPSSIIEQETANLSGSDACSPQFLPLHAGNEAVDYASDKQEQTSMLSEDAINHVNSGSPVEGKEENTSIGA